MFIAHLDLLSYGIHTKFHCLLSTWWPRRFLPDFFTGSEILFDSFCQRSNLHLQRSMYLHPAKSLLCFAMKPCQCRISPEDGHRTSLAVSNWNAVRHPTSTVCCVVLVLGAVSQLHIRKRFCMSFDSNSEAWADLINFLLNCCLSNVMITFSHLQISFQCLSLVHFS